MGGEIGVESAYDKGSTFWFTARFGLGVEPQLRGQRELPDQLRDLRVLVVDDHPTARTIFARYLESFGFRSGESAYGADALDKLETAELPYQLVLIDWHMPGMDGIEVSRRIQESSRIKPRPEIIMVSAPRRIRAALEAGDRTTAERKTQGAPGRPGSRRGAGLPIRCYPPTLAQSAPRTTRSQ